MNNIDRSAVFVRPVRCLRDSRLDALGSSAHRPGAVLAELAHVLSNDDLSLLRGNGKYMLKSRAFESLTDVDSVRTEAQRIVVALSGISRILLGSDAKLKIGTVTDVRPDGHRHIFVQLEPAVMRLNAGRVSVQVTHPDGRIDIRRPADPAIEWLTKSLTDPLIARALRLRDAGPLSWTDLYRLYEVIENGAGGEDAIVTRGWATRVQLKRFKHSANSVSAAGDQARHGIERTTPPRDAMSQSEGRLLVDELLRRWLGSHR